MPRYMKANVTKEEFKKVAYASAVNAEDKKESMSSKSIGLLMYINISDDDENIHPDLQKVTFDTENTEFRCWSEIHGSAVAWCYAGGDREYPVHFVAYVDNKNKLRFYIPNKGNTYCHKCKCAYGSCECGDDSYEDETSLTEHEEFINDFLHGTGTLKSDNDTGDVYFEVGYDIDSIKPDYKLMAEDAAKRLVIKE